MIAIRLTLCAYVIGLLFGPASADLRELSRNEIRANVQNGQSLSLGRLLAVVSSTVEGDLVDVRAFEGDAVYYRVLMKQPNGKLAGLIFEARTGRLLSPSSDVGREVIEASRSRGSRNNNSDGNGNPGGNGNGNPGGNGNGNAGGSGNRNSGGNDNGNSGGNGKGNSGGNGNGNSGGNGNGNSGGNGNRK